MSRVERIAKLRKGLRRKKISAKHLERVQTFLKEGFERWRGRPNGVPSDDWYRENVSGLSDGELECDDGALVSAGSDPGAYVQTWSWVAAPYCDAHDGEDVILPDHDAPCPKCAEEAKGDEDA